MTRTALSFSPKGKSDKTNGVSGEEKTFATVDGLSRMRWLVHGFGRAGFGEADLAAEPGFAGFRPVIMKQVHSDRVHRLAGPPEGRPEGDALVTDRPGLLLVVRTADCLPVLLADEAHRAVAAVHCGWRGTRSRILEKAVRAMESAFGTRPVDLAAALGPCIGPCCYEVGPEVREGFKKAAFPTSVFSDRSLLDLRAANAWLLESLGVPRAAIGGDAVCTRCEPGLYSYRRDPGERRRLYNFIGIRRQGAESL
jgi:polyphenol oxidase